MPALLAAVAAALAALAVAIALVAVATARTAAAAWRILAATPGVTVITLVSSRVLARDIDSIYSCRFRLDQDQLTSTRPVVDNITW